MNSNPPDFYSPEGQSPEQYARAHAPRLDYIAERFKLRELSGKRILDVGCGLGFLFERIDTAKNHCLGVDNTALAPAGMLWKFVKADLNVPFAKTVGETFDAVFCLETIEHLTNPYNCLFEIKELLAPNGYLILSIPHESIGHNTIYPDQLYPVEHFMRFLRQMAFEVILHERHTASFSQEVFVLKSLPWDNNASRMRFLKDDANQRDVPPHVAINL